MQHEKRSSERQNVTLEILINHDFLDPRRWRTRDLSMDSAFVQMNPDMMLPGAHVELVVLRDNDPSAEPLCLRAVVVRVCGDGIAIRFQECDADVSQNLRDVLNGDRYVPEAFFRVSSS
jgi:hypothetical protein